MRRGITAIAGALTLVAFLAGCDGAPRSGNRSSVSTSGPVTPEPGDVPTKNPCAQYPPPFEASYLPEGFEKRLRKGAGLFAGTNYPTRGLVGHYLGGTDGIHVNFQIAGGPLPYEPANPRPLSVLGRRGAIGKIEGGWSVELSLDDCEFRMDTYGLSRAETIRVARGLRAAD